MRAVNYTRIYNHVKMKKACFMQLYQIVIVDDSPSTHQHEFNMHIRCIAVNDLIHSRFLQYRLQTSSLARAKKGIYPLHFALSLKSILFLPFSLVSSTWASRLL